MVVVCLFVVWFVLDGVGLLYEAIFLDGVYACDGIVLPRRVY